MTPPPHTHLHPHTPSLLQQRPNHTPPRPLRLISGRRRGGEAIGFSAGGGGGTRCIDICLFRSRSAFPSGALPIHSSHMHNRTHTAALSVLLSHTHARTHTLTQPQ